MPTVNQINDFIVFLNKAIDSRKLDVNCYVKSEQGRPVICAEFKGNSWEIIDRTGLEKIAHNKFTLGDMDNLVNSIHAKIQN